ncbi:MAG: hypothetical protein MJE68_03180 [Proteobacteria bacterium]|nr:hypothetical protein [Pseudomonadota bacterium]
MEEKLSLLGKSLQHVFALFPSNGLLRIGYSLQGEGGAKTDHSSEY